MALKGWRAMPQGAIVSEPGSSRCVDTGSWRVARPVIDFQRCTHCMVCWLFCADSCFLVAEMKLTGVDYDHCKGCGICAAECPKQCIAMVDEVAT